MWCGRGLSALTPTSHQGASGQGQVALCHPGFNDTWFHVLWLQRQSKPQIISLCKQQTEQLFKHKSTVSHPVRAIRLDASCDGQVDHQGWSTCFHEAEESHHSDITPQWCHTPVTSHTHTRYVTNRTDELSLSWQPQTDSVYLHLTGGVNLWVIWRPISFYSHFLCFPRKQHKINRDGETVSLRSRVLGSGRKTVITTKQHVSSQVSSQKTEFHSSG